MYDRSTAKSRTERRRATPRPLGRRPLRELPIIHTGVGLFLEMRRVGEGLCADKVKNSRRLQQHLLLRFLMRSSLSRTVARGLSARVCCTCSANHGFPLPLRTGPRRRAAHNRKWVPLLGCAGTDGKRFPEARGALSLFPCLARLVFLPCLACPRRSIHRLSTHMERKAQLSNADSLPQCALALRPCSTTASDGRASPSPSSSRGTHFSFISLFFFLLSYG
ncbi:hypothetical protein EDB87DRAFT_609021 [Lactarius vividus]|nr:hypothetical protein EDB87DRAFT_609021 [Lactarius vividus]